MSQVAINLAVFCIFFVYLINAQVCTDESCSNTEAMIPKGANAKGKPMEAEINKCHDRHKQCETFKNQGECEKNPGWMIVNCPVSCNSCHLLDPKVRCNRNRLNITDQPILKPGDMNRIFEEIIDKYSDQYTIDVVSRDPWIITFDNFLSDAEVDSLIAESEGRWERSTDTGERNAYGETGRVVSQSRTSSNAWCRHDCESNPNVASIITKIEDITQVPRGNYESFQVLRYEIGQKYNTHHDASVIQNNLACGLRILTFFLYLSDVEQGGETGFPNLKVAVKPMRGKGLLWANTLNMNPDQPDQRTMHEARPVIQGVKYAANTWIHMYDFAIPNLHGCTGKLLLLYIYFFSSLTILDHN